LKKILIVGSGGREYSIGLAISKEQDKKELYFYTGNGATNRLGKNITKDEVKNYDELADFVEKNQIDLTIVGPEQPLVDGIVDVFQARNLTVFGPSKNASQLEGSKVYMKNFLKKYNIPTAKFLETNSKEEAFNFIDENFPDGKNIVVKADGLCAGKGVIIAENRQDAKDTVSDMLNGSMFGEAGSKVIVEEFLDGYELSVFAITDGTSYKILPPAQDHKRLLDHDKGPNTGGMGAYAPTPLINDELMKKIEDRVLKPTLDGMKQENSPYTGVLFMGLMVVDNEPITLEFNVRFGDPECEILMPLFETPISEILYKASTQKLHEVDIKISDKIAIGVVMASKNYPYGSSIPAEIIVDEVVHEDLKDNVHISYAGVTLEDDKLFATGGRVLVAVALGDSIQEARNRAYLYCGQIHFLGKQFRHDIAYQALAHSKK
jgi:phosphoribosylamine--glycine ligase